MELLEKPFDVAALRAAVARRLGPPPAPPRTRRATPSGGATTVACAGRRVPRSRPCRSRGTAIADRAPHHGAREDVGEPVLVAGNAEPRDARRRARGPPPTPTAPSGSPAATRPSPAAVARANASARVPREEGEVVVRRSAGAVPWRTRGRCRPADVLHELGQRGRERGGLGDHQDVDEPGPRVARASRVAASSWCAATADREQPEGERRRRRGARGAARPTRARCACARRARAPRTSGSATAPGTASRARTPPRPGRPTR